MPSRSVLVVDDVADVRESIGEILRAGGYIVVEAEDGERALALMREAPPDLVLLDIMMPKMNGWEVLDVVRGDANLAAVPVVIMTASGLGAESFSGRRVINKPFTPQQLFATLTELAAP